MNNPQHRKPVRYAAALWIICRNIYKNAVDQFTTVENVIFRFQLAVKESFASLIVSLMKQTIEALDGLFRITKFELPPNFL